jgi:hypothetical protein
VQEVLLLIRKQEEILVMSKDKGKHYKSESEEEEPATERYKSTIGLVFEDGLIDLTLGGMPLLQKSFGKKNTNAILLKIFSIRNNSIDFLHEWAKRPSNNNTTGEKPREFYETSLEAFLVRSIN